MKRKPVAPGETTLGKSLMFSAEETLINLEEDINDEGGNHPLSAD